MSLQVWLPLNGDTVNQGLCNQSFSNSNTTCITVDTAGKIGKCYNFNSTVVNNGIYSADNSFMANYINNKSWTVCAWVNTSSTYTIVLSLSYGLRLSAGAANSGFIGLYNSSRNIACYSTMAVNDGKWHHIAGCYNAVTNEIKYYTDGVVTGTANYTSGYTYASSWTTGLFIGRDPNNNPLNDGYHFKGKLNDVRIYDHCLTQKEVKEISKGLVAHYKLSDPYISKTLVVNGFGELGTEGWSNSSLISTTEKPSADSTIKASTYNGNQTTVNILVNNATTYTISAYIKSSGATSGTTYPSIFPIDADGRTIMTYNSADGFGTAYKTTLARPLRKGDTVIYATDLSAWTTANNNYYYHVAIFGYKDSSGRLYPDMGYTADSPVFGSYSDKSHIDKTNNTITLNAAFTGEDRPIGTTICQATEGSTYIYPFGGIALNTLSDWVFKSATLSGSSNRLKYAKYMRWYDYSNIYVAGLTIKDDNWSTTTVYDSSGYKYNGTIVGSLSSSVNTARYSASILFANTGNAIQIPFNAMLGSAPVDYTISVWTYKESIGTNNYQTIIGGPSGFEIQSRNGSGTDPVYVAWNWNKPMASYEFNKWTHFVFVRTSSDCKLYVNGTYISSGTTGTVPTGNYFIGAWNSATQQNYEGRMSDFRIYTTALSADDVKELYQSAAHVDKNNFYAYEFVEG